MAGFQAWLLQRISAVYLGIFIPVALLFLLLNPPASYADWLSTIGNPWVFTSVLLFTLAALIHAWIGIRDIVIDYVKPFGVRMVVLLLIGVSLMVAGFWMVRILLTSVKTFGD